MNNHKYHFLNQWLGDDAVTDQVAINDLIDFSQEVEHGDIFIDLCHDPVASQRNIMQAIDRGASAVLSGHAKLEINAKVPLVVIPGLKSQIAKMASDYYDEPSKKLQLAGITGTNGKTTTALLMSIAANELGQKSSYIGTIGYGHELNKMQSTGLTTPSAVKLQRILSKMVDDNVNMVTMEVSSHALVQNRVENCIFDVGIFTNLSRDHLDFHQSMFDYAQAKRRLFTHYRVHNTVLNVDDPVGAQWEKELDSQIIPYTFKQVKTKRAAAHLSVDYCDMRGNSIRLQSPWGKGHLVSPLMGRFNTYNLASAWLGLVAMGFGIDETANALSLIQSIPGRFEVYRPSHLKPTVVIDYAHTPSALEEILLALRNLTTHHVWVIFGLGGDRDHGKRPLMGQIAERLADRVMLTSDNPRLEDPENIVSDILKGMICPWAVEIELDRAQAIYRVIHEAKAGDVVLVAGKGHEEVQIIKRQRMHYSDKTHVLNALGMVKEPEIS